MKSESEIQTLARLSLEKYSFPVVSMIAFPNGTVIHTINANVLLDEGAISSEESIFDM